ncbi:hypothetical protein F5H01DRAFT_45787 [Linnemannia elongata]|nr:hypothetical protein F5H01DRAFT_45787 [Linnemannia elongata]
MLSLGVVPWCCPLMLSLDVVHRCYPLVLSLGVVHRCCRLALSIDVVAWRCPSMLSLDVHDFSKHIYFMHLLIVHLFLVKVTLLMYIKKLHLPSVLFHTSNPTSTLWTRNSIHNTRDSFYKIDRQHPRKAPCHKQIIKQDRHG